MKKKEVISPVCRHNCSVCKSCNIEWLYSGCYRCKECKSVTYI